MTERIEVLGLTRERLESFARSRIRRGAGLASTVYRCAMRLGTFEPERHGLGAAAAAAWREDFDVTLPAIERVVTEPTELGARVAKAVLRLADGAEVECVDVPIGRERSSLCVSTQVGCAMACRFCETGRMGKLRDMTAAEIVGQVVVARARLGWNARSIVFMGMGEPLDNTDGLIGALRALTDRSGLGYAHDRLTVCTVGHVEGIRRLAELGWKRLNLSISLNAADDATRRDVMPVAARASLAELQAALAAYRQRANFQLGVHYCLMPGINDGPGAARDVAAFCAPLGRVMVQVIPYNPGTSPVTRAPSDDEVASFVERLRSHGLPVRRRITKGRSVMAACGQLGDRELRTRLRTR